MKTNLLIYKSFILVLALSLSCPGVPGLCVEATDPAVIQALDELQPFQVAGEEVSPVSPKPLEQESEAPSLPKTPGLEKEPMKETVEDVAAGPVTPQDNPAPEPIVIPVLLLRDVDILSALQAIENKTGLTIIADADVTGTVSLQVNGIEVRDVLQIILEPLGLAFHEEFGLVRVMIADDYMEKYGRPFPGRLKSRVFPVRYADLSLVVNKISTALSEEGQVWINHRPRSVIIKDMPHFLDDMEKIVEEMDIEVVTEILDLKYARAEDVVARLKEKFSPSLGQIRADNRSNTIVVTDTKANIERMLSLIRDYDKQKSMNLKARILLVDLCDEHQEGVDWEAIVSDYHPLADPLPQQRALSVGTISGEDFPVLMDALDLVGDQQEFKVSDSQIKNYDLASLDLTAAEDNVVFLISQPPDLSSQEPSADTIKLDLYLRSHINLDDQLVFEVSLPDVEAESVRLKMEPGHVVIIGGLFREEKIDRTKKFPILGSIPFLGVLFRSRTTDIRRIEHIIFLTPEVVVGQSGKKQ